MNKLLTVIVVLIVSSLALLSCGPRAEALTADAVADSVNLAKPLILLAFTKHINEAVSKSKSREEAVRQIVIVRRTWTPIVEAHNAMREAHNEWATSIEENEKRKGADRTRTAYCVLRALAQKRVALPNWPGGCGSGGAP